MPFLFKIVSLQYGPSSKMNFCVNKCKVSSLCHIDPSWNEIDIIWTFGARLRGLFESVSHFSETPRLVLRVTYCWLDSPHSLFSGVLWECSQRLFQEQQNKTLCSGYTRRLQSAEQDMTGNVKSHRAGAQVFYRRLEVLGYN